MNCPKHGDFTGLMCKPCFVDKERRTALDRFHEDPDATFKAVRRGKSEWHCLVPGMGDVSLCGKDRLSIKNSVGPHPRSAHREIMCKECLRIGWPHLPIS